MLRRFAIVFSLLLIVSLANPVFETFAQGEISQPAVDYTFGKHVHFTARLTTPEIIKYVLIYFQEMGHPRTYVEAVDVSINDDGTAYQLDYSLDPAETPIRAFSNIEYRFEVTLQSGEVINSPTQTFTYIDDRFDWQVKGEGPFQLHWYRGGLPFAQKALDTAQSGLERIQSILPLSQPPKIDIYVYPSSAEMQETLLLAGQNWVAGHADPDLGVIVVALPPGPEQQLLTEQRIPHELMHVMLYQALGSDYEKMPRWLNEGLASSAELFPNPDYQVVLEGAYTNGELLPLASLCSEFPRDASGALLAYAQSASLVNFLHGKFGAGGMENLIGVYADGVSCEAGLKNVFGVNLTQLESQWRQTRFGEDVVQVAYTKLLPWLIILLAILIVPIGLILIWLLKRPARRDGEAIRQ